MSLQNVSIWILFTRSTPRPGHSNRLFGYVPDRGLLVARDIVLHMLTKRPDIQEFMRDEGYRMGVVADTDSTMDIPEHRDWETPSSMTRG